jgi:hypothetical protein
VGIAAVALLHVHAGLLEDGRQSPAAFEICRGVARLLSTHAMAVVTEVTLANGRRADVAAIGPNGEIWIVEIKSSLIDFQTDQKWPKYRDFCDRFFFAVGPQFPQRVLPVEAGLVIADRYGGEVIRLAPEHKLVGARRKAVTLTLLRTAANRLQGAIDPEFGFEFRA